MSMDILDVRNHFVEQKALGFKMLRNNTGTMTAESKIWRGFEEAFRIKGRAALHFWSANYAVHTPILLEALESDSPVVLGHYRSMPDIEDPSRSGIFAHVTMTYLSRLRKSLVTHKTGLSIVRLNGFKDESLLSETDLELLGDAQEFSAQLRTADGEIWIPKRRARLDDIVVVQPIEEQ
jgi:hypothetical protein